MAFVSFASLNLLMLSRAVNFTSFPLSFQDPTVSNSTA